MESFNTQYDVYTKLFEEKGEELCVDCSFPPEKKTLGPMKDDWFWKNAKDVVWSTPDEIFGKGNYKLFRKEITPYDVVQGGLGTCYFLAAAASLAED